MMKGFALPAFHFLLLSTQGASKILKHPIITKPEKNLLKTKQNETKGLKS